MEIPAETFLHVAQWLGAVLASFGASWLALGRPLARRLGEQEEVASPALLTRIEKELGGHGERLARVENAVEQCQEAHRKLFQLVERLEERSGRTVTDEEFRTYVSTTTESLQNLIEKLGHVTGQFEAWTRAQSGR